MPFGLSWVLVVPALWILNAIIMVHTIVFAWIQRKGPAPVRARQFGTNVGQLAVVLIALPLVTYITSLPYLHPFFGGWVTDVLDAVILPSIGMCIFAWGRHLKSTYGEPASLAAADEDTLEPPIEVEST
ncbi:hypothetical protein BKA62DRAFT_95990 [Auriculariales sp. MPI-PUGE-AT-0066]|nr:hypothetical protein BKA62DRAFT_95990 [Auriculariales sp. MPI-PUGE-AT-0066]